MEHSDLTSYENIYFKVLKLDRTQDYPHRGYIHTRRFWLCECKRCGSKKSIIQSSIVTGKTKSCGCLRSIKGQLNKGWTGCGSLPGEYFYCIQRNARKRKIVFQITIQYLWSLFLKQKGLCKLTRLPLEFHGNLHKKERGTASLDRIDNAKGYIKGNLRWVHKDVNYMKRILTDERLFQLAALIVENRK